MAAILKLSVWFEQKKIMGHTLNIIEYVLLMIT